MLGQTTAVLVSLPALVTLEPFTRSAIARLLEPGGLVVFHLVILVVVDGALVPICFPPGGQANAVGR
jgi:hypothetical protein